MMLFHGSYHWRLFFCLVNRHLLIFCERLLLYFLCPSLRSIAWLQFQFVVTVPQPVFCLTKSCPRLSSWKNLWRLLQLFLSGLRCSPCFPSNSIKAQKETFGYTCRHCIWVLTAKLCLQDLTDLTCQNLWGLLQWFFFSLDAFPVAQPTKLCLCL